jgi:uncharacterized protein YutD
MEQKNYSNNNSQTKINNIKNLQRFIIWYCAQQCSWRVDSNILNVTQVASEMFNKLDS